VANYGARGFIGLGLYGLVPKKERWLQLATY